VVDDDIDRPNFNDLIWRCARVRSAAIRSTYSWGREFSASHECYGHEHERRNSRGVIDALNTIPAEEEVYKGSHARAKALDDRLRANGRKSAKGFLRLPSACNFHEPHGMTRLTGSSGKRGFTPRAGPVRGAPIARESIAATSRACPTFSHKHRGSARPLTG